ncbi:sugar kinase [Polaromonas jejuensis]|uniref:Sugar kinase n=1 Tax=Polaromonas jejuensis TaxID=457502 RepID=A0ABW0QFT2_9BURK|nr:sugar kinase [Polaromonas jejuensis]
MKPFTSTFIPAFDVLTVGEPMALFAATRPGALSTVADYHRVTAGAELNVATGLARLDLRVGYISRVGKDSFGQFLLDEMAREGIDCRHVAMDELHPTGFMLKTRSADGSDPQVEYFRRGSAASHLGLADLPSAEAGGGFPARHLHLTGITPALSAATRELVFTLARQARAAGASISFDPNLRPRLWPSQSEMVECLNALAAETAGTVLPGLAEGRLLTGRDSAEGIADFYLALGAQQVVVKLGPQGAYFADRAGRHGTVAAAAVAQVVDTVGAGDGFAAGVISALLEGLPLAAAVARGNAIGARVVQFPGDSDGLPTRRQLSLLVGDGIPAFEG